jgi:hypothetical protein
MIDRLNRIIERIDHLIQYYAEIEQYEVCQQLNQYKSELLAIINQAKQLSFDDI